MQITQIYDFVNTATQEALGETTVVAEDLSNIVDIGTAIFNANAMDKYVKALVSRIGRTIFVNRVYQGSAPSVLMDSWEYGSVLQKVSMGLPEATENETWELTDGQSYDPHIFHAPKDVQAKYFNKYVTFEVDMSFTEEQLKMSFTSSEQMNGFISMIYTQVDNTMTVKIDELIRRTINNMIGETIHSADIARAINLLTMYKAAYPADTTITAETCMNNPDFIRYAAYIIKLTHGRMKCMSTVFNEGGQPRHTPTDLSHIVLLEDFASGADVFLQSNTFHDELSALPTAETVPYWQGSGTGFAFEDVSTINIKTVQGNTVEQSGIIGVMFDRWALGVGNLGRKVTSEWTPNAEFFTNFYKYKAAYYNDFNENFVVFYVSDSDK